MCVICFVIMGDASVFITLYLQRNDSDIWT